MNRSQKIFPGFALVGIVLLQTSCGGDSSGPSHVATTISAHSPTTLTAAPGSQVSELPSVLVRDQDGAPMAGAQVTFTVTAGGGSVTGANATTNTDGIATVGSWTLGTSSGTNTLTATTANLPAVTFTANSVNPCVVTETHTIGTTSNGELTAADCKFSDGSFVDFYGVTLATDGTYVFNQTATTFDTFLLLYAVTGVPIGVNDDFGTSSDSRIKAILPAGNYVVAANSYDINITGKYALSSAADGSSISNCETVFVMRGSGSAQSLESSDCPRNGFYEDHYFIYLTAGQVITVAMNSSAIDSFIGMYSAGNSTVLAQNDDKDGTTKDAQLTFTAPSDGFYVIAATSGGAGATGAYSFTIQ